MDPQGPDDPYLQFFTELNGLRSWAGQPSSRVLARKTAAAGYDCSHTTVAKAFKPGRSLPRWEVVRSLVRIMGGDERKFHRLWLAASGRPVPVPVEVPLPDPAPTTAAPGTGSPRERVRAGRDLSLWSWHFDYDPASAPPAIQLLAAALRDHTDVPKLMMGMALGDPRGTAPVLNIAIDNDLQTAAGMVADVAQQDPSKAAMLLREATRLRTHRVIALLRVLAGLPGLDLRILLIPALHGALHEPEQESFARDLLMRLYRAGHFDYIRDQLVEMATQSSDEDFSAVAFMIQHMLRDPADRGGGVKLLAYIAKADLDTAAVLLMNIVTERDEPARRTGPHGRTLLSALHESWPSGTRTLLMRAVINHPRRRAQLSTALYTLCQESFDQALDLILFMTMREASETGGLILTIPDVETVARILLAVHRRKESRDPAGRILAMWIRARHPTVVAPAGFLLKQLAEIDPAATVGLLVTTVSVSPSVQHHDATAGLLDARERRELVINLYRHATRDQSDAIKVLF